MITAPIFPNPEVGILIDEWAHRYGKFCHWTAVTGRYSPPRSVAGGDLYFYTARNQVDAIVMFDAAEQLGRLDEAVLMVDDGDSLRMYYCAGWNTAQEDKHYSLWHQIKPGISPVAPHRVFHLLVTEA